MNLFDLLHSSVECDPKRPAVVFGNRTISYGQLVSAARRVSSRLQSLGVEPGARVLMYSPNCPEYLPIYLGCAHAGAIFAPVNTEFRAREMGYVLDNARADAAFVHTDVLEQFHVVSGNAQGVPQQIIQFASTSDCEGFGNFLSGTSADDDPKPAFNCATDQGALLCYTSGTTSTPKPVLHSHNSEIYAAKGYVAAWRVERSDRGLVTLPLAWIYGLSSASLALLVAGATVVLMTHFNPERALERIQETRATVFFGSMSMYVKMLDVLRRRDFELSSLRLCINGAEPCPEASVQAFEKRTGIRLTGSYALSEVRPVLSEDPLDADAPLGTCGRLVPGAAIRLLDPSGQEVPAGEAGEAFIRCPGMLTSYFREPQLTEQRLGPDGYLKTGDLVRRDARGYYFMVGRIGDMIIRSGVNIAPAEIEAALLEHANISQAIVLGVPDPASGQAIVAFVVPSTGSTFHEAQLWEHLSSRIAQYKLPQKIIVRADLPTNASGKPDRATLNALAQQLMASHANLGAH
jgi:acyl-CoA synthetase (AMP-forming)/AMP-acid ligase II